MEVLPREPEDRECAGAHRRRLDDEQDHRARPDQPERREEREQWIDVPAEPGELLAVLGGRLEQPPVRRVPDRLHGVAEVVAGAAEADVVQDAGDAEHDRVRRRGDPNGY